MQQAVLQKLFPKREDGLTDTPVDDQFGELLDDLEGLLGRAAFCDLLRALFANAQNLSIGGGLSRGLLLLWTDEQNRYDLAPILDGFNARQSR